MRFGAGIWLFGQFVDRYAADAYGPEVSTLEAIARAGEVGSIEVLDINYPFSDPDITVDEGSPDVISAIKKDQVQATVLQPAALIAEMAVEQADEYIKSGKASKPEKQSIDCELVNKANADQFGVFAKKT